MYLKKHLSVEPHDDVIAKRYIPAGKDKVMALILDTSALKIGITVCE